MVSQISCWQVPSPTWGKGSFDKLRDFDQPSPPGVDFAYQKCNVSTRLSPYNNFESFIHTSQLPNETSSTHTTHAKTLYTDHSIIPRSEISLDSDLSNSYTPFQSNFPTSSLEPFYESKGNNPKKNKGKKKNVIASIDCHPPTQKDQKSKNTCFNKKKKLKKRNSVHNCEDQKFYHETLRAEPSSKEQRQVEITKQDRFELKIRPNYSSINKLPLKNDESNCIAMKLPPEILLMIAENSTAETTLALTLTCQKWYNWLTDMDSTYIGRVWRRSRNNSHPDHKEPKTGKCEMIYTIQKMRPKPSWLHECDMCYKKSSIMTWNFRGRPINTCYSCKKMYEVKTNDYDKEIY
ncbi:3227_t:CDS:2 [Funneliformis mosseae]|uniref:3227_t:CDS:1 n=1 Tax=Funneliformis mosseae TaxID=27381 RepID=A0A9N9AU44_FUNMO|nr:3227_t:CDS:2 [Funneliformis mosseae]